jgi:NHLM bacteriocin system ABC transporter ATP-binding protein
MSWFEDQMQQRKDLDQQVFEDSFYHTAGAVLGRGNARIIENSRIVSNNTIDDILKYYNLKSEEIPASIEEHEKRLEYCLRPHGIFTRKIVLSEKWYKDAIGPIMAYTVKDNEPVAFLPGEMGGYYYRDHRSGNRVKVTRVNAGQFSKNAYSFYKPLPQKKLTIEDLIVYMKDLISFGDGCMVFLASLAVTLVGMLLPKYAKALTGPILNSGSQKLLLGIAICMVCTAISSQLLSSVYAMLRARLSLKSSLGVQAAMIMRMMSLPASFFKRYSTGELLNRLYAVDSLCKMLVDAFLGSGLMSLVSLLYIRQIFSFTPELVIPSLVIILVMVGFTTVSSLVQIRVSKKIMELKNVESGVSYSMIRSIPKIKLAGAEKRFFARWLRKYADSVRYTYAPPMLLRLNSVITLGIGLAANIVLYFIAADCGVSQSDFYAYTVAYGMVMGAFKSLAGVALSFGQIKPVMEMASPFLDEVPETSEKREEVLKLSGSIELGNVSFRYDEKSPYILKNLSLKIKEGEYVAIVGKTGCGKSTLVRLLLGFETPVKGAIYFGNKNIENIDLSSLRRHIGVVMQNGGLFQGDIYSNIVISAPELSLDAAWEAAEIAGIADDIRAMPMGMSTLIAEGQGGISGGQKQRLMIARAVAPKPKILIFDEATSALDNVTQKKVSEALDKMGCTRIVIAHRLSTIKNCDRILVIDNGSIIESGNYDQLMEKKGFFAELVERQKLDA